MVAKEIVQLIYGDEVNYPSTEDVEAELDKEWVQELQHRYQRPGRAQGDKHGAPAQPRDRRFCLTRAPVDHKPHVFQGSRTTAANHQS